MLTVSRFDQTIQNHVWACCSYAVSSRLTPNPNSHDYKDLSLWLEKCTDRVRGVRITRVLYRCMYMQALAQSQYRDNYKDQRKHEVSEVKSAVYCKLPNQRIV